MSEYYNQKSLLTEVSAPQFDISSFGRGLAQVSQGLSSTYDREIEEEKIRKADEEKKYQRSRDALVDSRYEADRKERLDDKFDAKQKASMTNEALALIGNKDAFLSGKISAENKAYADALAQISDPVERARLEQDVKGYQTSGQQKQGWIDSALGQSNIDNSKILDLKRDMEKESENKRRFELGYDIQKAQLAQSRADSAYSKEFNEKKLQLERDKLNIKEPSAMEKDLATLQRIYGKEEGQNAFDKKYNPDSKTGTGKSELPASVVDKVMENQKSFWIGSDSEQKNAANLLNGLKKIKHGLNLKDDAIENLSKVALGESTFGAGNINEEALESFFGKDTMVDQNGKAIPIGNAVKEILNNPDRFSIVNSGGKNHFIDLDTPSGKKLNEMAFGSKDEKIQTSDASENKRLGSIKGPTYYSEGSKDIPVPGYPVDPTKSGAQQIGEGIYKGATGVVKDMFAPAMSGVSKALDSSTYTKAAVSVANALASSANEVAFSPITASRAFTEWLITGKADESSISSEADTARKIAVQSLRKMGVEQPTNEQIKNVLDGAASIK